MLFSTKDLNFLALYEILTQPKVSFAGLLRLEGRRRHDRCIPRVNRQDYSDLAFKYLLDSGNDQLSLEGMKKVWNHGTKRLKELLNVTPWRSTKTERDKAKITKE
jgi:hypothetical protein